jgi:hypothetical protein
MDDAKSNNGQSFFEFEDFHLDPARRLLLRENQPVQLQPKAFDILLVLLGNSGRVVSKELMSLVWPDAFVEESAPAILPAQIRPGPSRLRALVLAIAVVILAAGGVTWYLVWGRPTPVTEQDSIVLADFENRTGDSAFDVTLKKVLEVEISQSPYLNILPNQDVRCGRPLVSMRRSPDESITRQVGSEICQRSSSKAQFK